MLPWTDFPHFHAQQRRTINSVPVAENQAKLSDKGVFIPVLRSVKWISVLLYFKISHFHQELIQRLRLARKMRRGSGKQGDCPNMALLSKDLFHNVFFSHPTPTHISPYTDCSKVQEAPALVSDTALANLLCGFMLILSDLWWGLLPPPPPKSPIVNTFLLWSIKEARDSKLYNAIRIKIWMIKVTTHEWVCLSKSGK